MSKEYKYTELGPIPVEWEIERFGDVLYTLPNNTLSRDMLSDKGAFLNIHYGDVLVKFPAILDAATTELPHIDDISFRARNIAFNGDIVMADTAEDEVVGKVTELQNITNQKIVSGLHTIWLRPKDSQRFAPCFLGYFLNCPYYHSQLKPLMQGIKVLSLSKRAIAETKIALPSLDEQEKIAEALSDVDALIAELGELIEKKRLVKQGTMQQLLTASRRLPGFSSPWVEKELGKIGITYSGLSGKTKEDFGIGEAHYITFLNVLSNPKIRTDLFESVRVGAEEKQNKAKKGDLFFNTSSETPEEVGICSYLDENIDDLYLNSFCFGYRVNDSNVYPLYLAYFFRSQIGRDLMSIMAQGVTRYNISKSAFNKASIFIPSDIEEQRAIAEILTDMDNEIAELEAKREKYRAIKDGMMQQLLTGRIRLIDPTASTDSATSVASSNPAGVSPHAPVITYEPTTAYPHSLAAEPKISE